MPLVLPRFSDQEKELLYQYIRKHNLSEALEVTDDYAISSLLLRNTILVHIEFWITGCVVCFVGDEAGR